MHRVFVDAIGNPGDTLRIDGDEAHHALRVKRLRPGELLGLLDGAGAIAEATIERVDPARRDTAIEVRILSVEHRPPTRPALHVFAPAPKGGALEHMIDQLSQAGAASWVPLRTEFSEREPRSLDRLRRVAVESAKQCGRAHLLQIRPPLDLDDALAGPEPIIVADADGEKPHPPDADEIRLLVGPEGGWSNAERAKIAESRARLVRFGPHVMRIETAAVVAVAILL